MKRPIIDPEAEAQTSEPHQSDSQTETTPAEPPAADVSAKVRQAPPCDPVDWLSVWSDAVRTDFQVEI